MAERARYERSCCCVLGCRRWSTLFPAEWMCAEHWKMLPKAWRTVLRRSWRRERDAQQALAGPTWPATRPAYNRRCRAADRLWARAKRHVTLKAAGL